MTAVDLRYTADVEIDAPRERVVAVSVSTATENVRQFDPRVQTVQVNEVPDGEVGQVATITALVGKRRVTMTSTTLESHLPDYIVERYTGPGPDHVTRTHFTELPGGRTRVSIELTIQVPWWNPLLRIALRIATPQGIRDSLGGLKTYLEAPAPAPGERSDGAS